MVSQFVPSWIDSVCYIVRYSHGPTGFQQRASLNFNHDRDSLSSWYWRRLLLGVSHWFLGTSVCQILYDLTTNFMHIYSMHEENPYTRIGWSTIIHSQLISTHGPPHGPPISWWDEFYGYLWVNVLVIYIYIYSHGTMVPIPWFPLSVAEKRVTRSPVFFVDLKRSWRAPRCQPSNLVGWLVGWLVDWLAAVSWLVGWLAGWLAFWLIRWSTDVKSSLRNAPGTFKASRCSWIRPELGSVLRSRTGEMLNITLWCLGLDKWLIMARLITMVRLFIMVNVHDWSWLM